MADYIIEAMEERETSAGKKYQSVTLSSGSETYEKVSLWSDSTPGYTELAINSKLVGEVTKNAKGYWNFKAEGAKVASRSAGAITKAIETKNNNIVAAQDRKNDSIRMAGAQRDAVLMVTTFEANAPFPTDAELKAKIESWMKYFLGLGDQPFI